MLKFPPLPVGKTKKMSGVWRSPSIDVLGIFMLSALPPPPPASSPADARAEARPRDDCASTPVAADSHDRVSASSEAVGKTLPPCALLEQRIGDSFFRLGNDQRVAELLFVHEIASNLTQHGDAAL